MERTVQTNLSGSLFTSLPEDVFTVVEAQMSVLIEYINSSDLVATEAGDSLLIYGLLSILRGLWCKQTNFRNSLLLDLESNIAAANDFLRMIEKVDNFIHRTAQNYPHLPWTENKGEVSAVRREAADLISLLGGDAVHAAQQVAAFVMRAVLRSDVPTKLFSRDWEDRFVQNEVVVSMVRLFEGYLSDIHNWVDQDFLYHKVVVALVRSSVCFYLRCLVKKADQIRRSKRRLGMGNKRAGYQVFVSPSRAMCRMSYDIEVLRDYFHSVAKENVALGRVVANELSVLVVIFECMWLAVGKTGADSLDEFIVVVHKRTGADADVTKHFLSDLWLLMAPSGDQHVIQSALIGISAELKLVSARMKEKDANSPWKANDNGFVGLRLDEMLKSLYEDRILQERTSLCGNILTNVKELREGNRNRTDSFGEPKPFDSADLREKIKGTVKFDHLRKYLGTREVS